MKYCFIQDLVGFAAECNSQKKILDGDLHSKTEENITLHEEVLMLSEEVKAYQDAHKEISDENVQLQQLVEELKSCRDELSTELVDMKVRI